MNRIAGFLLRRGFPMRLLVQSALCMDFTWENPSAPNGPVRLLVRKIRYKEKSPGLEHYVH
jgi:hypothetical protein